MSDGGGPPPGPAGQEGSGAGEAGLQEVPGCTDGAAMEADGDGDVPESEGGDWATEQSRRQTYREKLELA